MKKTIHNVISLNFLTKLCLFCLLYVLSGCSAAGKFSEGFLNGTPFSGTTQGKNASEQDITEEEGARIREYCSSYVFAYNAKTNADGEGIMVELSAPDFAAITGILYEENAALSRDSIMRMTDKRKDLVREYSFPARGNSKDDVRQAFLTELSNQLVFAALSGEEYSEEWSEGGQDEISGGLAAWAGAGSREAGQDGAGSGDKPLFRYFLFNDWKYLLNRQNYSYASTADHFATDKRAMYFLRLSEALIGGVAKDKARYEEILLDILMLCDRGMSSELHEQRKKDIIELATSQSMGQSDIAAESAAYIYERRTGFSEFESIVAAAMESLRSVSGDMYQWADALSGIETLAAMFSTGERFLDVIEDNSEGTLHDAVLEFRTAYEIMFDTRMRDIFSSDKHMFTEALFENMKTLPEHEGGFMKTVVDAGERFLSNLPLLNGSWDQGAGIGRFLGSLLDGNSSDVNFMNGNTSNEGHTNEDPSDEDFMNGSTSNGGHTNGGHTNEGSSDEDFLNGNTSNEGHTNEGSSDVDFMNGDSLNEGHSDEGLSDGNFTSESSLNEHFSNEDILDERLSKHSAKNAVILHDMMILREISDILNQEILNIQKDIFDGGMNAANIDAADAADSAGAQAAEWWDDYSGLSFCLIVSRIQGEYCMSRMAAGNQETLFWLHKARPEDALAWYENKAAQLGIIKGNLEESWLADRRDSRAYFPKRDDREGGMSEEGNLEEDVLNGRAQDGNAQDGSDSNGNVQNVSDSNEGGLAGSDSDSKNDSEGGAPQGEPLENEAIGWQRDEALQLQYLDAEGMPIKNSWEKYGDRWIWLDGRGYPLSNKVFEYKGDLYYLDHNGFMLENRWAAADMTYSHSGEYTWFYFQSDGTAQKRGLRQKADGTVWSFDADGHAGELAISRHYVIPDRDYDIDYANVYGAAFSDVRERRAALEGRYSDEDFRYTLCDLDGDGIRELIFNQAFGSGSNGGENGIFWIYTIENGSSRFLGDIQAESRWDRLIGYDNGFVIGNTAEKKGELLHIRRDGDSFTLEVLWTASGEEDNGMTFARQVGSFCSNELIYDYAPDPVGIDDLALLRRVNGDVPRFVWTIPYTEILLSYYELCGVPSRYNRSHGRGSEQYTEEGISGVEFVMLMDLDNDDIDEMLIGYSKTVDPGDMGQADQQNQTDNPPDPINGNSSNQQNNSMSNPNGQNDLSPYNEHFLDIYRFNGAGVEQCGQIADAEYYVREGEGLVAYAFAEHFGRRYIQTGTTGTGTGEHYDYYVLENGTFSRFLEVRNEYDASLGRFVMYVNGKASTASSADIWKDWSFEVYDIAGTSLCEYDLNKTFSEIKASEEKLGL